MGKARAPIRASKPTLPPKPRLPPQPTADDLKAYSLAMLDRAVLVSRVQTVEEELALQRTRHRPDAVRYVEAVRHRTSLKDTPESTLKRCKICRRVAVRGLEVCYFHGGAHVAQVRRLERGILPRIRNDEISAAVRQLINHETLPAELAATPVYRALMQLWTTNTNRRPILGPMLRELILAWYSREAGDLLDWTRAIAKCRAMNLIP